MANLKTAISIEESLFKDIDQLSHQMHISRSQLFAIATRDFVQRHQNWQLLRQINIAYDDTPDSEEEKWQQQVRTCHRRFVEEQPSSR